MSKWVLVPREPSEEMKEKGADTRVSLQIRGHGMSGSMGEWPARQAYDSMLTAAPSPLEDEALVEEIAGIILNAMTATIAARAILGRLSGR